jgi:choline kinase
MQTQDRTGLILAAGYGARQPGNAGSVVKPLVEVAGRPIIFRVLDQLHEAGCTRAVVVLGHEAAQVRRMIEAAYEGNIAVDFVVNPRYDLQNGISVLAARDLLGNEFVLSMADHVFDPCVTQLVRTYRLPPGAATLVVDRKLDAIFDVDDATKVMVDGSRITRIGKDLTNFNAVDCGIFIAGLSLLEAIDRVYSSRGDASLSAGVQGLASAGGMLALDLGACRWQDVDTPEMLYEAERLLKSLESE